MRVLVHQTSYDEPGDLPELLTRAVERIVATAESSSVPVDLVVLPELWAVGAFRPRAWVPSAEMLDGPTVQAMTDLARRLGAVVHLGAIVERDGDDVSNTALVVGSDGEVLARYRKIHLFRAGGVEAEIFTAGDEVTTVDLPLRDGTAIRAGLSTCYDLRFPELFRAMTDAGAQLFLHPASWPVARAQAWKVLTRARAVENQAFFVGAAACGTDGKTRTAGHSVVVDPDGEVLAEAGDEPVVLDVHLDPAQVTRSRESFAVLADRRLPVAGTPRPFDA